MLKKYYRLTKPGMVYGNVLTTIASFLFATGWNATHFLYLVFLVTIIGLSFVIASACVFNNYLDRHIDRKMERTKHRALVTGDITPRHAIQFGSVLLVVGFLLLYFYANPLTAYIALFGWFAYVALYSIAKRGSSFGALVGSISGGVPIVVGYTAVTGQFDVIAFILFVILALWQMPHFYAIALYRMEDYKKAGIPVLPLQKGMHRTKIEILVYLILYISAAMLLAAITRIGIVYILAVLVSGLVWLSLGIQGFTTTEDTIWAKKLFRFSLIVLLVFSISLALSPLLP